MRFYSIQVLRQAVSLLLMLVLLAVSQRVDGAEQKSPADCLIVIFDGLRPEYITPELMPHLHALAERGAVGLEHHAVYPTVTRVNATSLATGTYPAVHGMLYNEIYLPDILPDTNIDTADAAVLMQVEERSNGQLLTAPSLGELLDGAGKRIFVA
ncbi:MAG: alkaline phosphatase family protein, partial [Planctomycetaceae bacterium]|nr:alkaline phosphatase family protein [Planctomycetaceae bacterium]